MSISLDKNLLSYQYYDSNLDKEDVSSISKLLNNTIDETEMMNLVLKSEQNPTLKRLVSAVIRAKAKTSQYMIINTLSTAIDTIVGLLENGSEDCRLKAIGKIAELYNLTRNIYNNECDNEMTTDTVSYIQSKLNKAKKVQVYESEKTADDEISGEDSD